MPQSRTFKAMMDMLFWKPSEDSPAYEKWGDEDDHNNGYRKISIERPLLQGGLDKLLTQSDYEEFDEKILNMVKSLGFNTQEARKVIAEEFISRQRYRVTFSLKNRESEAFVKLRNILETDERFSELVHHTDFNMKDLKFGDSQNGITQHMKGELEVLAREIGGRVSSYMHWMVDSQEVDAYMANRVETIISTSNDKLSLKVDGRFILTTIDEDTLSSLVNEEDFILTLEPS